MPWPVEPPLQIWRCPLGASHEIDHQPNSAGRTFEVHFGTEGESPQKSLPTFKYGQAVGSRESLLRSPDAAKELVRAAQAFHLVQERADVDISGPEFNFVRSIRVFDVRYARQYESGRDEDCNRSAIVVLGTYGTQGEFAWQNSTISALPAAHAGLERWGDI